MIHHDTPQHQTDKPSFWLRLLVALLVLAPFAAAILTAYPSNDGQHRADTNAVQQDANAAHGVDPYKGSLQQGTPPKPNDTPFYDAPTPATQLTTLYTDALREAVKNKDTKACQTGLENFRKELSKAPMAVIRDIDSLNDERDWQVPTYFTFLDAAHFKYACQQAAKLRLMSDLVPDTRARNALSIIDNDVVLRLSEGTQKCFDLLSVDYKYYVQNTSIASKVMLALLVLTLPQELSDEQFATLCDHPLDRHV